MDKGNCTTGAAGHSCGCCKGLRRGVVDLVVAIQYHFFLCFVHWQRLLFIHLPPLVGCLVPAVTDTIFQLVITGCESYGYKDTHLLTR